MKFLSIVFLTSLLIGGAKATPLTIKTASCKGYDYSNDPNLDLIEITLDSSDSSNTRYRGAINGEPQDFWLYEVKYSEHYGEYVRTLYGSTYAGSSALQLIFYTSAQLKSNYNDAKDYGKLIHASFLDRGPWGKYFSSDASTDFACEITFLEE